MNALTFGIAAVWVLRMKVRSEPSDVTGGGQAGPHLTMLVYGLGIPALCLLTLPRLVKADRLAAATAASVAPRVAILQRLEEDAATARKHR